MRSFANNDSDIFENEISLLNQSTENVKNEYEEKVNEMILNLEGMLMMMIVIHSLFTSLIFSLFFVLTLK